MNRLQLLEEMSAGRARLELALEQVSPEQMLEPILPGGWSVKDLLAHLGWWQQRSVELFGQPPDGPQDVDATNALVLEEYRPLGLAAVRSYERETFARLVRLVEMAPEGDLLAPGRFAWLGEQSFADWVLDNSSGHYDEHLPDLLALQAASSGFGEGSGAAGVLQRALDFLEREGRDIDQALADYAFRGLSAAAVLDVLAGYQNPDGGFTRLEVDIAAPVSNPFAAELALRVLSWMDPPRDHPLVRRLVAHLEQTQDEGGNWRFAPEVYQAALAPWFQGWQWPNFNPTGQIAGTLRRLGLGSARLHARAQGLFERQARPEHLATGEYYDALPYGLYFQAAGPDAPPAELYRSGVAWWLLRQHARASQEGAIDASHFMELVARPDGPIARLLPPGVLAAQLDRLLAEQHPDGGWPTPYDPRWRSWITAQNLLILKAHGRLGLEEN